MKHMMSMEVEPNTHKNTFGRRHSKKRLPFDMFLHSIYKAPLKYRVLEMTRLLNAAFFQRCLTFESGFESLLKFFISASAAQLLWCGHKTEMHKDLHLFWQKRICWQLFVRTVPYLHHLIWTTVTKYWIIEPQIYHLCSYYEKDTVHFTADRSIMQILHHNLIIWLQMTYIMLFKNLLLTQC